MGQIIQLIDSNTKENVNYEEVSAWHDGTLMDDGKVDNIIYRKKGDRYFADCNTLSERTVNVRRCGATGNVDLDTRAFLIAFNSGFNVLIPPGSYLINETLTIKSRVKVYAPGATITWVGDNTKPLFRIDAPSSEVQIDGGLYAGTPAAWLQANGATYNPTQITHYARFTVQNLHVSGADIFIDAQNAARFRINNVNTYTKNGINCYGKIVELKITNSIIFGSTSEDGTYGIKAEANPDADNLGFCEGFHISNVTIDGFKNAIALRDIFVFELTNSWVSGNGTYKIHIRRGITGKCTDIVIDGNTIDGSILFESIDAGNLYRAKISNNNIIRVQSAGVYLQNNTYDVEIINNNFDNPNGTGRVAVLAMNNVGRVTVRNNKVADEYVNIFQTQGASGNRIVVANNEGGMDVPVYVERPVRDSNNGSVNPIKSVNITGGAAQGTTFAGSISDRYAKGSVVLVTVSLNYTSSAAGIIHLTFPTFLKSSAGTGWDDRYKHILASSTLTNISFSMLLYASEDGQGNISLRNESVAATVTAGFSSNISVVKLK